LKGVIQGQRRHSFRNLPKTGDPQALVVRYRPK
jgi:hypothetical protein